MKILKTIFLLILISVPAFAGTIKNGEDLVAAMRNKYLGKWYKTMTFVQKTIRHKEDGTSSTEIWYEAIGIPGKLRIDIAPSEKGNGLLFSDGTLYSFRDGKQAGSQPFLHPLLVMGFDVYGQPVEKSVAQLKELKMDLSIIHEDVWQGRKVYVVGAKLGDLKTNQFWVDKKNLYFVRMFETRGKDGKQIAETQFNKYKKTKRGAWASEEVLFYIDGKLNTTEEYSDVQTDIPLNHDLWDPSKWMTVDRSYYKKP